MTVQTGWRIASLLGALVALSGYIIRDFGWPTQLVHYAAALMGGGGAAMMIGLANARRAAKGRGIALAGRTPHAD